MHESETRYMVGLDVGSTTVKAVVLDAKTDEILWQDYQRHETKQPEKTLEFLKRFESEVGVNKHNTRMFMTGSGGGMLAELIGAKFVQEVTAVALAVEKMHPEVYSVIELGGQDAKIIVFKDDNESGRKKKIPSMNDKCAGGTGAVIDKINGKLKIPTEDLGNQGYHGVKLHKVAGKCGVFAETDINGLQKVGTPPDELMASLFDAIVLQNLSVLTRGHTLRPHVLLLGGPNSFIRGMREAWQPIMGLSEAENDRAIESGFQALQDYESSIRKRARQVLDQLEREDCIGIVMLGRPYHHDPGLNHEILEEFQKLGYPIFSQNTLPLDEDMLERLFGDEVRAGVVSNALDITDAWKNSYSCSTNHKVWAAKFTARHPNLVALEMSSFKCGHDAPIYGVIEGIIENSGTPYFCFKDLDENKPSGSIRIRVETIDYFLRRYREQIIKRRKAEENVEAQLAQLEAELRRQKSAEEAQEVAAD